MTVLTNLIKGSNFEDILTPTVKVIHIPTIGAKMTLSGTMYVTAKTLQMSDGNEDELAMLIAHELSHYILGHLPGSVMVASFMDLPFIRIPLERAFNKMGKKMRKKDDKTKVKRDKLR